MRFYNKNKNMAVHYFEALKCPKAHFLFSLLRQNQAGSALDSEDLEVISRLAVQGWGFESWSNWSQGPKSDDLTLWTNSS